MVEMVIRGIEPSSASAGDELYGRLDGEEAGDQEEPTKPHGFRSPRSEIAVCDEKTNEIVKYFEESLSELDTQFILRTIARSVHLEARLQRLVSAHSACQSAVNTQFATLKTLAERAGSELARRNNLHPANPSASGAVKKTTLPLTLNRPHGPKDSGQLQKSDVEAMMREMLSEWTSGNQDTPRREATNRYSGDEDRDSRSQRRAHIERQAVNNWHLTFEGEKGKLTIEEFLFRVERLARAEEINLNRLPALLHMMLKGRAEAWYWVYARDHPDAVWDAVSHAMRDEFRTQSTDYEIRRLVEDRKQAPGESFSDFRLDVVQMVNRMTNPIREPEIIDILRRNMNPRLQNYLLMHNAFSLNELRDLCRQYEKLWALTDRTRNTSRPVSELDDETDRVQQFDCPGEDIEAVTFGRHRPVDNRMRPTPIANNNPIRPQHILCWNCENMGHTFRNCQEQQRRLFCYGCGTAGYAKFNCVRCNEQPENPRASSGSAGAAGSSMRQ